ncbi:MAG: hypothetical protein H7X85_00860 [Thermoanaerobaculia bacterium]|nr:hypothetical protein [Thermoanaerobaculia bacterium]
MKLRHPAVTLSALALWAVPTLASAVIFTVTNTNDSGAGSLRQAILDANGMGGTDDIVFAIPGSRAGCSYSSGFSWRASR